MCQVEVPLWGRTDGLIRPNGRRVFRSARSYAFAGTGLGGAFGKNYRAGRKSPPFPSSRRGILAGRARSRHYRIPRRLERSEEHTSELQSHLNLVCRLLLEKKNKQQTLIQHLT